MITIKSRVKKFLKSKIFYLLTAIVFIYSIVITASFIWFKNTQKKVPEIYQQEELVVESVFDTPEYYSFINSRSLQNLRDSSSYKNLLSSPDTEGLIESREFKSLFTSAALYSAPYNTQDVIRFIGSDQLRKFIGSDKLKILLRNPETGNLLKSHELGAVLDDQSTISLLRSPMMLALGIAMFQDVNINEILASSEWQGLLDSSEMQSLLNDPQILANLGGVSFLSNTVNTEASFIQSFSNWPRNYMQGEETMYEPGQTKVEVTDVNGKAIIVSVFMPWERHDNESSNLGVFSYIIRDSDGVYIVDPGPLYDIYTLPSKQKSTDYKIPNQVELLMKAINKHFADINNLKIKDIILTNWHPEHIEVAPALQLEAESQFGYKPPIRINDKDKEKRTPPNELFSLFFNQIGATAIFEQAGYSNVFWGSSLTNGIVLGNSGFTVIETPGYTNGSIALKNDNLGYVIVDDWAINTARGGMSLENGCEYIQERGCEIDDPQALLSSMGGCDTMLGGCDMTSGCSTDMLSGCDITSLTGCSLTTQEQDVYDTFLDSTSTSWFGSLFNFF